MSMFARRHYEFIADTIYTMVPDHEARLEMATMLAHRFKGENAQFKTEKFIDRATKPIGGSRY